MGEPENVPADRDEPDAAPDFGGTDSPLTIEVLAELQAGLLDDDDAARIRKRVRADPEAQRILAALNAVRRDVAAVGASPVTAFGAPAARGGVHLARPHLRPARAFAGAAGLCAVAAAIAVGTFALVNAPEPTPSTQPMAQHITVSTPPVVVPLSRAQILALLDRPPQYGSLQSGLADASRRASCLHGLGYPAGERVLGAQPVEINARPGVVLVLPGDTPDRLAVFAVALSCSAADTGLLANTEVPGP